MLLQFLLSCLAAGSLILVGEYLRRKLGYGNEVSRKLVHVVHGLCMAVWPFIVGYWIVFVVEAIFVVSVLASYKLHWFRWLWKVGRKTWGEYMYPAGVVIAALVTHSKWIFLAGVLELAFADAAAALIGKSFGRNYGYKVFKQTKSVPGTAAFFVVSVVIIGLVVMHSPEQFSLASWSMVLAISAILTAIENLGVYGFDNLLLPVVTVMLLNSL